MTSPENSLETSDARCRQLGDLAAQAAPMSAPDVRQWQGIEAAMARSPGRRRWLLLLAPTLAAAGLVLWLQARRGLDHTVHGCQVATDGTITAPADSACHVTFEDGTRITLAKGTRGRVDSFGHRRGAAFALDHGQVDLAVVHREAARWDVLAGPYDVHVTGTRFSVDWTANPQAFALRVSEGEVRVTGCREQAETPVRAGQGLNGDASRHCVNPEPAPAAPAPTVATVHAEAAPAPVVRGERRRSPASGKLAMRSPEVVGKTVPPAPPEAPLARLAERDWSASNGLAPESKPGPRRLTVGPDGHLAGTEPGTLVAIGGTATTFSSVAPNNLVLEEGALCARGKIGALKCNDEKINMRCDWSTNWGVLIQWQPRGGQVWGDQATSSLALEYRGKSAVYRLVAHHQGDPDDRMYCVDHYRSGQRVTPSQFTAQCWNGGGPSLPDFSKVDYFSLQVTSEENSQRFRYCISAIDLR